MEDENEHTTTTQCTVLRERRDYWKSINKRVTENGLCFVVIKSCERCDDDFRTHFSKCEHNTDFQTKAKQDDSRSKGNIRLMRDERVRYIDIKSKSPQIFIASSSFSFSPRFSQCSSLNMNMEKTFIIFLKWKKTHKNKSQSGKYHQDSCRVETKFYDESFLILCVKEKRCWEIEKHKK